MNLIGLAIFAGSLLGAMALAAWLEDNTDIPGFIVGIIPIVVFFILAANV